MDLQLACAWLQRDTAGLSDIEDFAARCLHASRTATRESAALLLLAQAAQTFAERQSGVAANGETFHAFLARCKGHATMLRDAAAASDASFLAALNAFAAQLSSEVYA
ncbi:hypothetical protein HUS70_07115 [Pandoraea nosoerga]|uniref:Uncharacterized protein n=2 Tax=Burkholderiaceae TaxID=119060 RepID=A0A5E4TMP7_9BURK|nr:hypothetical protein [Pandoraea nosoerga]MBN4675018.1 hypothetical protein [Pandoraea nosoerga]MBN4680334.1 hypothetical protein [Pandoraea nosoerga]MBN4744433.1 hypothetical protein [Pandoraea nosoerga]VVD87419.1 hypothetical protein PNO31109_01421 [Pandoraea nosoerga]